MFNCLYLSYYFVNSAKILEIFVKAKCLTFDNICYVSVAIVQETSLAS